MVLLFSLKERLRHPLLHKVLEETMLHDKMCRDEFTQLVAGKLHRLLVYAVTHIPYYRSWWCRVARHGKIPELEDFPVVSKADIRGHEMEFISDEYDVRRLEKTRTSGSTGEPFIFYRDRNEWDYSYATLWRGLMRFGIHPGDKRVLVKGVDEERGLSLLKRVSRAIYGWINRCLLIDAHFLASSPNHVGEVVEKIVRYRPMYLHGYVSSIYQIARFINERSIDVSSLKVKAIVTESEKLHDFQRELIAKVFHVPVVENYGSVEFGMIAQPDQNGNLCINEDHVVVETTPEGDAVITNLDEYGFPFIRFKNGDRLELGDVSPTLPYKTIKRLNGRVAETIHLPNGGSLQGFVVMYPISKHMKWIKAYQVHQTAINRLVLRFVVNFPLPNDIRVQILREMRDIVGSSINVEIEVVNSIPLSRSGKCLFVRSDI